MIKYQINNNYSIKIEPTKKNMANYIFIDNETGNINRVFKNKDLPNALTKQKDVVQYIIDLKGWKEEYLPKIIDKKVNTELIPSLTKLYNETQKDKEKNEKQNANKEKKEVIQRTNDEAKFWEYHIYKFGLIPILNEYLRHIALGDKENIYSKLIHAFGVLIGEESYYQTTVAHAEAGKSYQDDILYSHYNNVGLIPEESVIILDEVTKASFRNKGSIDSHCYDRKIIYAGDKGEDFDEELDQEVKSIVKKLITDKKSVSEKDDGTGTSTSEHIELYADSIAWVENTVINIQKNDNGQRNTRSINYTIIPEDNEKIMSFIGEIFCTPDGRLAWNYNHAYSLLKTFSSFLRKKVWDHENRNIHIPQYMMNFFIQLYKNKEFGRREFMRHLVALRSLFELQTASGDVVDDSTFNEYCELFLNETTMPPLINNLYLSIRGICDVPGNVSSLLDAAVMACGLNHKILDELDGELVWQPISNWLDISEDREIQKVLKKLLQLYRVRNSYNNGRRYFFTVSDLRHRLKNSKAYKNVFDVGAALEVMQRNGLIDCLEEQVKINGNKYRIWYLLE